MNLLLSRSFLTAAVVGSGVLAGNVAHSEAAVYQGPMSVSLASDGSAPSTAAIALPSYYGTAFTGQPFVTFTATSTGVYVSATGGSGSVTPYIFTTITNGETYTAPYAVFAPVYAAPGDSVTVLTPTASVPLADVNNLVVGAAAKSFYVGFDGGESLGIGDNDGYIRVTISEPSAGVFTATVVGEYMAMDNGYTVTAFINSETPIPASVPEPASLSLIGAGVFGLLARRRRSVNA